MRQKRAEDLSRALSRLAERPRRGPWFSSLFRVRIWLRTARWNVAAQLDQNVDGASLEKVVDQSYSRVIRRWFDDYEGGLLVLGRLLACDSVPSGGWHCKPSGSGGVYILFSDSFQAIPGSSCHARIIPAFQAGRSTCELSRDLFDELERGLKLSIDSLERVVPQ